MDKQILENLSGKDKECFLLTINNFNGLIILAVARELGDETLIYKNVEPLSLEG